MAGFKTHTAITIAAAVIIYGAIAALSTIVDAPAISAILASPRKQLALLVVMLLFSMWPDVDTNSVSQDIFYLLFFIVDVTLLILKMYVVSAYIGLAALLPILGKHRGWTHSTAACLLMPLPLLAVPMFVAGAVVFSGLPYYIAGVAGYSSHLLVDRKWF